MHKNIMSMSISIINQIKKPVSQFKIDEFSANTNLQSREVSICSNLIAKGLNKLTK